LLSFGGRVRVFLAAEPMDLRRGFDGLAAATRQIVQTDPLSGHVFAFVNRRRNRMKLLIWEPSGYWLLYKRLEKGRFNMPHAPRPGQRHLVLGPADLMLMLEGIDLRGARRRERWEPQKELVQLVGP